MRKTSAREFSRFKKEAQRLIQKLGLTGWRVVFEHSGDENGSMRADLQGRVAVLSFGSYAERIPEEVARHEVLELFLARFEILAKSRFILPDDIGEEKHAIIRTLENML